MSSNQKEILLNQLASLSNIAPPKPFMPNNWFNNLQMSSPNPELLKALHAMNSFSALQANYNMMANGNGGQELLSKITNPLIPPLNMNPMNFGLLKTPAPFNMDLFSKFDTLNHQNVSPASGTPNMIKERMNMLFSPFMNPLNRPQNIDDAEHASLVEKSKSLNSVMGFPQFNKNKTVYEKKIITIDDEDEDVVECKPEDFLKNVCKIQKPISKIKSNSNSLVNQKSFYHSIIRNSNVHKSIHRKYESKLTKKPIKSLISIENSGKNDETQLKFFAENNLIKRNFIKNFKKKTKKGFLSHRKNHRNQKRREKIVLNCKKCNSRIIIFSKKTQKFVNKLRERFCKNCLFESLEKEHNEKKNSNELSTLLKNKQKKKEEDTESKSDTIYKYKEMMFSNTNRILLGENYQAEMPEFFLNNSKKMNDLRSKKRNLLLSHKIWNPCEENAKLYDEVYQMISTNYSSTYTHYDFVTIIDQYQGDIKLIKLYLEKKEVNLMNILTESISNSGRKRVTRSSKHKFRSHESN